MKNIFLAGAFLWCGLLLAQNSLVVPPQNIRTAFENQYPKKKAVWDIEYSGKSDDIIFEAQFNETAKTIAFARYDKDGLFKAYKVQILLNKLPQKAQTYLKKNYSTKSYRQFFSVVNDLNVNTYEANVIKDAKFYSLNFDKNGEFFKRVQIR
jgi:hypothetical protein